MIRDEKIFILLPQYDGTYARVEGGRVGKSLPRYREVRNWSKRRNVRPEKAWCPISIRSIAAEVFKRNVSNIETNKNSLEKRKKGEKETGKSMRINIIFHIFIFPINAKLPR